jgi:hypothetical protein
MFLDTDEKTKGFGLNGFITGKNVILRKHIRK